MLLVCSFTLNIPAHAKTYELGGLYTLTYSNGLYADWGDYARISAQMAVEDINNSGILGDDKLSLQNQNILDFHCAEQGAKELGEDIFSREGLLAVVGVDCSGPAAIFADIAEKYKVPAIAYGGVAELLGNSERYPYYSRTMSPSSVFERVFFPILKQYSFNNVAILHTTDIWGTCAKDFLLKESKERDVNISSVYGYDRNSSFEKVYYYLSQAKSKGIKQFIIVMPVPDTAVVFQAAHALGMDTDGYAFYSSELLSPNNTQSAITGGIGVFAPKVTFPQSPELDDYIQRLSQRVKKEVTPASSAFMWGVLGYDNIRIIAEAISLAKKDGKTDITGEVLMPYIRKASYTGLTGYINIEEGTNNRQSMDIDIMNLHGFKKDQSYIARWFDTVINPSGPEIDYQKVGQLNSAGEFTFDESKVVWPGGGKTAPNAVK